MYTSCMFCNRDLGRNEVVEVFPVGRRLAFDAVRGRLWVVCHGCERWNLTPLEERWEAVESCERIFRGTRLRAQTPQVGMARTSEGLELVRIGDPLREEFAAWRYGDQFGRRRKKTLVYGVGFGVVVAGLAIGGLATGLVSGALVSQSGNFINLWHHTRTRAKLRLPDGTVTRVRSPQLADVAIVRADDELGWALRMQSSKEPGRFRAGRAELVLRGEHARRAATLLVPAVNAAGGNREKVRLAVRAIEEAGDPEAYLQKVPDIPGHTWNRRGAIGHLPVEKRLALEMALHEEQEMRAMQGELWRLERAWKEAEEIAAIADELLVPTETIEKFDALKSAEGDSPSER